MKNKCPACKGDGYIVDEWGDELPCPECGSSGYEDDDAFEEE